MREEKPKDHYLFVCTGSRCSELSLQDDEGASLLQKKIKAEIKAKGYDNTIRVSKSGCLGACEVAPNVMFQPENRLCSGVELGDAEQLIIELCKTRTQS